MADKKTTSRVGLVKRKEKSVESKAEKEMERKVENKAESNKQKEKEKEKTKPEAEDEKPKGNGETAQGAEGGTEDGEFQLEPIELPPFEIIIG